MSAAAIRVSLEPLGDALALVRIEAPLGECRQIEKAAAFILGRVDQAAALPENPIGDIHPRLAIHHMPQIRRTCILFYVRKPP